MIWYSQTHRKADAQSPVFLLKSLLPRIYIVGMERVPNKIEVKIGAFAELPKIINEREESKGYKGGEYLIWTRGGIPDFPLVAHHRAAKEYMPSSQWVSSFL